jgi:small subunit ribosomal protein S16
MGNTNRPFYRIVAIDSRKQRDGRALQELGYYDPLKKPAEVKLLEERIQSWLDRGAEPSETVRKLLQNAGILEKRRLVRDGVPAEEAATRVSKRLESKVEKKGTPRLSKKAKAKAEKAAAEADA